MPPHHPNWNIHWPYLASADIYKLVCNITKWDSAHMVGCMSLLYQIIVHKCWQQCVHIYVLAHHGNINMQWAIDQQTCMITYPQESKEIDVLKNDENEEVETQAGSSLKHLCNTNIVCDLVQCCCRCVGSAISIESFGVPAQLDHPHCKLSYVGPQLAFSGPFL